MQCTLNDLFLNLGDVEDMMAVNLAGRVFQPHGLVMSNIQTLKSSARWHSMSETVINRYNSIIYCSNQMLGVCFEFFNL